MQQGQPLGIEPKASDHQMPSIRRHMVCLSMGYYLARKPLPVLVAINCHQVLKRIGRKSIYDVAQRQSRYEPHSLMRRTCSISPISNIVVCR